MAEFNQDYLKWDSNTLKRVITRKLSENPIFTDQVFEDSNLTTLVDVFAYMYDVLTYYLNHGASEAMFNDSQIYENLNRIVKMLGYNPTGFTASQVDCVFFSEGETEDTPVNFAQIVLPKYTSVDMTTIRGGLRCSYRGDGANSLVPSLYHPHVWPSAKHERARRSYRPRQRHPGRDPAVQP